MKLHEILQRQAASQHGDSPCVVCLAKNNAHRSRPSLDETMVLSYKAAWQLVQEHVNWLKQILPAYGGDRQDNTVVAYLSSHSPDLLWSLLAATSLNHVTVALLNTRWTPQEMARALASEKPHSATVLLFGNGFEDVAQQTAHAINYKAYCRPIPGLTRAKLVIPACMSSRPTANATSPSWQDTPPTRNEEDALVIFTSGTSSASGSKGVRLSHGAILVQAWAKCQPPCAYDGNTRILATTVPLYHVAGLNSALALLWAGGTWVYPLSQEGGAFHAATVLDSISASPPLLATNTLVMVPAMLHALLQHCHKNNVTILPYFPSVRLILIGGQSAPPSMIAQLQQIFPSARMVQTYACTEAASSLTFLELTRDIVDRKLPPLAGDCVGVPPPHVELVLLEPTKKDETVQRPRVVIREPHRVGILATRGPHTLNGYWNRDVPHPSKRRKNDWFITNDLGFIDAHGRFYFCGRLNDVIRTGGETVVALEVEKVLLQHENVRDVAVFGLPDERFGKCVCAALVMRDIDEPRRPHSLETVREYCAQQGLAGYKRPRKVFLLKELPRNQSGKLLKYKLVEQFKRHPPLLQSRL